MSLYSNSHIKCRKNINCSFLFMALEHAHRYKYLCNAVKFLRNSNTVQNIMNLTARVECEQSGR